MSTDTSAPSPELFFDTVQAYQRTAALRAAIDLDLFTAIADGAHTVAGDRDAVPGIRARDRGSSATT